MSVTLYTLDISRCLIRWTYPILPSLRSRVRNLAVHTGRLSAGNTNKANLCLTNNPTKPQTSCIANNPRANLSSLIGPNHTNHRFRIVKLVLSIICPSLFSVIRNRWSLCSNLRLASIGLRGGSDQGVMLGSSRPVRALNRGKRWRGHGITRKS